MRINSDRSVKALRFVYIIVGFSLLFDFTLINIDGTWGSMYKISPVAILLLLFVVYRGLPAFNYDSDGEVLNFTAKEPNLLWFGSFFSTHFEFPKRKLESFTIKRYPLRRVLTVKIKSKDGGIKKQKVTVSYLSRKELSDLKRSLNGVVSHNKLKK